MANTKTINPSDYKNDNPTPYLTLEEYLASNNAKYALLGVEDDEQINIKYIEIVRAIDTASTDMDGFSGGKLSEHWEYGKTLTPSDEQYELYQSFMADIRFATIIYVNFFFKNDQDNPQGATSFSLGSFANSDNPPTSLQPLQAVITKLKKWKMTPPSMLNGYPQSSCYNNSLSKVINSSDVNNDMFEKDGGINNTLKQSVKNTSNIGTMSQLDTENKNTLVAAINEVNEKAKGDSGFKSSEITDNSATKPNDGLNPTTVSYTHLTLPTILLV